MWVMMEQHKTSDQYLTSGKVSTKFIHGFKRYRLLKTLTKNFYILSNADAYANAVVTAIALRVLSYRQANKETTCKNTLMQHTRSNYCETLWVCVLISKET